MSNERPVREGRKICADALDLGNRTLDDRAEKRAQLQIFEAVVGVVRGVRAGELGQRRGRESLEIARVPGNGAISGMLLGPDACAQRVKELLAHVTHDLVTQRSVPLAGVGMRV